MNPECRLDPQPRITVVTVSHNQARYLERTICSVLDQGYENLEYIVMDRGSTDYSGDVIGLYEDELAWWGCEPDVTASGAINQAIAKSTGQVVGILQAGEVYLPGALAAVAEAMSTAEGVGWVVGRCGRIDASDRLLGTLEPSVPGSLARFLKHDGGMLPLASSFWRRSLVKRYGLLDESIHLAFDYEYCCRLLAGGEHPTIIPHILAACREREVGRSAFAAVREGMEYITASRRYADRLPLAQRYALWVNCDFRERIYTLAQAEIRGNESRRFLWHQLIRRPWWLAHNSIRHALMHGANHRPELYPDHFERIAA